jgi:hypothetical protein
MARPDPGASALRCRPATLDAGGMSMSQHPSYRGRLSRAAKTPAERPAPKPVAAVAPARRYAGRACCCPAAPAVIVMMPPAHGRQSETDLLLCGHHYRASKAALAAAGATVLDMNGVRLTAEAWPDPR